VRVDPVEPKEQDQRTSERASELAARSGAEGKLETNRYLRMGEGPGQRSSEERLRTRGEEDRQ
jgi:hypothetical protein